MNYEYGELNPNGTVDTTKNTGNIAKQSLSFAGLSAPLVQTYKYDSLYRISEAKEVSGTQQTWIQTFGYDRYGNRTGLTQDILGQQLAINNVTLPGVDQNTNRFAAGQGYVYDKIGNLTKDVTASQSRDIKFDGNNKQTEIKDSATGYKIGEYFYDGNAKRVKKRVFDSSGQAIEDVVFVYSGDRIIAEYSTQPPPQNPTTKYVATDTLGSVRAITNQDGQVISRRDFMPFGEEFQPDTTYRKSDLKYNPDDVRQKFTGYQKDEESGLDFAEARMYNNSHGRFTAVDPLLASGKSANPQTFNRYVYVMNTPTKLVDKNGLQAGAPATEQSTSQECKDTCIKVEFGKSRVYKGENLVRPDGSTHMEVVLSTNGEETVVPMKAGFGPAKVNRIAVVDSEGGEEFCQGGCGYELTENVSVESSDPKEAAEFAKSTVADGPITQDNDGNFYDVQSAFAGSEQDYENLPEFTIVSKQVLTLKDSKGNVLDQKTFLITATKHSIKTEQVENKSSREN